MDTTLEILCDLHFRKKGGKKAAKKDATIKSMSTANSRLWEARIEVIEKSRQEYKWVIQHGNPFRDR